MIAIRIWDHYYPTFCPASTAWWVAYENPDYSKWLWPMIYNLTPSPRPSIAPLTKWIILSNKTHSQSLTLQSKHSECSNNLKGTNH